MLMLSPGWSESSRTTLAVMDMRPLRENVMSGRRVRSRSVFIVACFVLSLGVGQGERLLLLGLFWFGVGYWLIDVECCDDERTHDSLGKDN